MAYRIDQGTNELVIDGFEKGIAASPYLGIGNMIGLNASYYPGVAYVNYRRQQATNTVVNTNWYAGAHSTDNGNNFGWIFAAQTTITMTNPVQEAVSPSGIIYILDDSGNIWKQSAVNSSTFNYLAPGNGRKYHGNAGLAFWNNYLVVFGDNAIEFCGNGTGDAAVVYSNWNLHTNSTAVVQAGPGLGIGIASAADASVYAFTGTLTTGATSATLTTGWGNASGSYTIRFSNTDERVVTFTNASTTVSWTGGLSTTATTAFTAYQFVFQNSTGYSTFNAGDPVMFSSTGTLPTGISANVIYYLSNAVANINGTYQGLIGLSSTLGGKRFFPLSSSGSGTITMTNLQSPYPIHNTSSISFTWSSVPGSSTSATLSTAWLMPSGIYNIVDPLGNSIQATFTYDSTTVTFLNPTVSQPTGTYSVDIINPSSTSNRAYVSKVDGNLYFANGRWLGAIIVSPNANAVFTPGVPATYSVSYAATGTLQPQDSIVDMTDLQGKMIIAGNYDLYPWDYVSAQPSASSPVGEQICRLTNLLNNIYLSAGTKGNLYVLNGYSAQLLIKIPDFIAGVMDPIWKFGGMMAHRSKLWFQALAQSSSGSNIMSGIFSLIVSPSLTGEQASGLVIENINSYGLTQSTGALQNGVLVDYEKWSSGVDKYYSAWSNGATTGGIDYNDNSPWQNFEPTLETDIIPLGSILDKKTLGQGQFKLDRPMTSGDQISIYFRPSLTDSYTLVKTTASNLLQLSDYFPSTSSQTQWGQWKFTFKCASSNSSFIPMREFRIQLQ